MQDLPVEQIEQQVEIVVEKDGQQINTLPESLKRDMEFLYDKGHNPDQVLLLPESCAPKFGEVVPILGDSDDIEQRLENVVLSLGEGQELGLDFTELRYLQAAERTLRKLQPLIKQKGIRVFLTPQMRREVLHWQRKGFGQAVVVK